MRLLAVLGLALAACTITPGPTPPPGPEPAPEPAPDPVPDAGPPAPPSPGDAYDQACATMAALGCAVGTDRLCAVALRRAEGLSVFDPACVAHATSKAAVRACGGVDCP